MAYLDRQRRKKYFEERFAAGKTKMQLHESVLMEKEKQISFTVDVATKLKKFMEKAQPQESAQDTLYYIFGQSDLFDNIMNCQDVTDVRPEVKNKLRELLKLEDVMIDAEARKILTSILEISLNEEILKTKNGSPIKVGSKVEVVKGPEAYVGCKGKVDWIGDDQVVVIFDDAKPVKQNLLNIDQLEVIKTNELDEDAQLDGDGSVTLDNGEEISVEVDGQIVTDPPVEKVTEGSDTINEFGSKLGLTDMLLQAVNDENSTIQFYNSLMATAAEEGFEDIVQVIKHINEEENIHVGMLQHVMTTISEQASAIETGKEEAETILNGEASEETPNDNTIQTPVEESFLMENQEDELVADGQALVDNHLKLFGRIGGGLYTELDELGLYIDESNDQYIVKRKVPNQGNI